MRIFEIFSDALKTYCEKHGLDFNKVKESPKCGNEMALFIQRLSNNNDGLEKNNPAQVLIQAIKDKDGNILIEHHNEALKYLSV